MEKNNFWQTTKGKATLKFFAWMIFIVLLIIYVAFIDRKSEPKKEENTTVETFKKYEEMQKAILENNYAYKYTITKDGLKYLYVGIKCKGNDAGFKETNEGIIKYLVTGDNTYKITMDNKEEYLNLYDNIDENYLNLSALFSNLKDYLYTTEKNEDVRVISYNKEGYQVKVTTNKENITNINITTENEVYDIMLTNIGKCDNLAFTN